MAGRRLDPEERALWARVAATVTPLVSAATVRTPAPSREAARQEAPAPLVEGDRARGRAAPAKVSVPPPAAKSRGGVDNTLDAGWDRRLRRGLVAPDRSIDLHGHTLATAHAALEAALGRALADEIRLLLVVTGRPPRPGETRRGLIRAQIGDWLAGSSYRDRIAAIRHAHPRHGGAGALYLILRRRRG